MFPNFPNHHFAQNKRSHFPCRSCQVVYKSQRALTLHTMHKESCRQAFMCHQGQDFAFLHPPPQEQEPSHYMQDSAIDFPLEQDDDNELLGFEHDTLPLAPVLPLQEDYDDGIPDYAEVAYTVDDQTEIALLEILKDIQAPLYAYKRILLWACKAYQSGYKFQPKRTTYQSQVAHLEQRFQMQKLRPHRTVFIPEGPALQCTTGWRFLSGLRPEKRR